MNVRREAGVQRSSLEAAGRWSLAQSDSAVPKDARSRCGPRRWRSTEETSAPSRQRDRHLAGRCLGEIKFKFENQICTIVKMKIKVETISEEYERDRIKFCELKCYPIFQDFEFGAVKGTLIG